MNFKNVHPAAVKLGVPASFAGKLSVVGTCDFNKAEKELFQAALICIDKRLSVHPAPVPGFKINVVLADTDALEISFADNSTNFAFSIGHYVEMIVFPVGLWRKAKLSPGVILFAMLEELSHAVWRIMDEDEVKSIVEELFKYLDPRVKVQDLLRQLTLESLLYRSGIPGVQIANHPDD